MTYLELQNALDILGLPKSASLKQIKHCYRKLAKQHHPDLANTEEPAVIRRINEAYGILLEYCEQYFFSFEEEEFYRQNPEEYLRMQFFDPSIWGSK